MIVLNVTYKCRPGMRDAFLKAIAADGVDTASRSEEDNVRYDYYLPADGGDEILLLEKWRDVEAFEIHKKQPHFARLGEIKAEYVIDTALEIFEI